MAADNTMLFLVVCMVVAGCAIIFGILCCVCTCRSANQQDKRRQQQMAMWQAQQAQMYAAAAMYQNSPHSQPGVGPAMLPPGAGGAVSVPVGGVGQQTPQVIQAPMTAQQQQMYNYNAQMQMQQAIQASLAQQQTDGMPYVFANKPNTLTPSPTHQPVLLSSAPSPMRQTLVNPSDEVSISFDAVAVAAGDERAPPGAGAAAHIPVMKDVGVTRDPVPTPRGFHVHSASADANAGAGAGAGSGANSAGPVPAPVTSGTGAGAAAPALGLGADDAQSAGAPAPGGSSVNQVRLAPVQGSMRVQLPPMARRENA